MIRDWAVASWPEGSWGQVGHPRLPVGREPKVGVSNFAVKEERELGVL